MEKKMAVLIVLGLSALLYSQTVPDFNTNDANGKKHHLYEYLESPKYVLIGFVAKW